IINGGFENELHRRLNLIKEQPVDNRGAESNQAEARKLKKAASKHFTIFTILLIIGGGALGLGIFLLSLMFGNGMKGTASQKITDIIGMIIFFAPCIVALVFCFICLGKGIGEKRLYKKHCELVQLKADLSKAEEILDRTNVSEQRTAILHNIDKLPTVKKQALNVIKQRNAYIVPLVKSCNVFYTALVQQFSPILDERDWRHLDLVIYQIETHRADSVKEALQLVDRELQTERIERAIGEATKAICFTLTQGFNNLQQSIKTCCNRICDRLDTISSQLDTVSKQMVVQSIQLAELTDSVKLGNALQAKANVTSAQLYNDLQAIRYYH
ncbi:MAG: hypothetical protein K2N14_02315, partial [Clostridia bacterium]|nr:hypothetical protein [Clostridia bacterium]